MSTITITKRNEVRKRAKGRCEYCRTSERITGYALEIDHIMPVSLGGSSEIVNLCNACRRCNGYKSDHIQSLDLQTGLVVPLFNPRTDSWNEHFTWSDDGTILLGQTPTGRATVTLLQINDPLVVHARALWVSAGWHPPTD
ncbi:MAG: HNH endonuclease [Ardenticatenaceae bacterium]